MLDCREHGNARRARGAVFPQPARLAIVVGLVAALLILPRLNHREIIGTHEAVYPVVARDMMERGAWLDAQLRGTPYRGKPPLYPWVIALTSWPVGQVTLTTARLPGALAAIGAVVALFMLGARLFGRRAGLWAAMVFMTSILFFDQALATIPDVPMIFIGLLAGLALWSIGNGGGRGALFGFYVALALGVFVKHFSGLLPLAVGLVWLGAEGGRPALKRLVWWPGIALFVAITAIWLVPMTRSDGGGRFATEIVWGDWLRQHIGGPRLATLGGELAYAVLGFMPWTLLFAVALVAAIKARRERAVAFALWWVVVPALFIFWVQQQRARYLLPLVAGAALLVAWWADREASRAPRRHAVLAVASLALGVAGAAVTPAALAAAGVSLPAPAWALALVLVGVAAIGLVAAASFWTARLTVTFPAVAAISAVLLFSGGWIVDEWQNRTWDFAAVARDLAKRSGPLAVAALAIDNQELLPVDFYLGRSLPLLRSPEAVRAHLEGVHGAVVMEDWRWREAREWLSVDINSLHAEVVGAGVVVVSDGAR